MFWRKEREIMQLKWRVNELEKRLCPNGHAWSNNIVCEHVFMGDSLEGVRGYKCTRCGKFKTELDKG